MSDGSLEKPRSEKMLRSSFLYVFIVIFKLEKKPTVVKDMGICLKTPLTRRNVEHGYGRRIQAGFKNTIGVIVCY